MALIHFMTTGSIAMTFPGTVAKPSRERHTVLSATGGGYRAKISANTLS
jgi:hypothetical protein